MSQSLKTWIKRTTQKQRAAFCEAVRVAKLDRAQLTLDPGRMGNYADTQAISAALRNYQDSWLWPPLCEACGLPRYIVDEFGGIDGVIEALRIEERISDSEVVARFLIPRYEGPIKVE